MFTLAWIAPLIAFALAGPITDPYPYTSDISLLSSKFLSSPAPCRSTTSLSTCAILDPPAYSVIIPKSLLPHWIDCKTLCGDQVTLLDTKTKKTVSAAIVGFDQHEKGGDLIVNDAVWKCFGGHACKVDWGFCEDDKDDHKPKKPHSTPIPHRPKDPSHPPKNPPHDPKDPPRQPPHGHDPPRQPPHHSPADPRPSQAAWV